MKKKIVLVLVSLLISATLLTTLYFAIPATSPSPSPEGIYHWKIELAQKKCNALIWGYLTYLDAPIIGTEFELVCINEEFPPPSSQRVFWKVNTSVIPTDIHFWKSIDWNMDGIWDLEDYSVEGFLDQEPESNRWYHDQEHLDLELTPLFPPIDLTHPICNELEEIAPLPGQTYHLSSWEDTGWPYGELSYCDQVDLTPILPPGPLDWWHVEDATPSSLLLRKMVVVEVHEQPYDPDDPFFYWQLMIKQHGLNASWTGFLTKDDTYLEGTDFDIYCNRTLQCQVVRTPYCTVPNDIDSELLINGMPPPISINETITQFPWTYEYVAGPGVNATLELTEVQMHRYWVMGGWVNTAGKLGINPTWTVEGPWMDPPDGVPFGSRPPYLMPMRYCQNITFTQRDPITGIVKLGVPAESYVGLNHTWFSNDMGLWFKAVSLLEDQGCGWIFTGQGKEPVFGSVDLQTYNNYSGVYTLGPDQTAKTADDELLAGRLYPGTPQNQSAGAGPPIGPCLQLLRGLDGIPGTGDDPIGRGDPDGPNVNGSSILFMPTTLVVTFWHNDTQQWLPLFTQPWPLLLTTGTSIDTVMEPLSGIDGQGSMQTGQPWEYFAGLDHPGMQVPWKDSKCNAYVHYATVWSVLNTTSPYGNVDILFEVVEKKVKEDPTLFPGPVIADINCDEIVDFKDLYITARAWDAEDEGPGPDGKPGTDDDKPVADPNYDARADIKDPPGYITIHDLVRVAFDYDFIPGYHVPDTWQGTISIVPPSPSANVGETFEVNVTVSGVTDLYLALFCISWDPAVLDLTDVPAPGDFLPVGAYHTHARINYTEGYLEAWTGTVVGSGPGATGSGTVATLEFEVVGTGSSPLDLYNCSWMDSTTGQYGFTTVQDGSFTPPCVFPVTWTWLNKSKPPGTLVWLNANVAISGCCQVVQNFNFTRSCPGCPGVKTSTGHISFDIVSPGSPGSCNVTIPKLLMDGAFKVLLNDTVVPSILAWNGSHTFVWFSYPAGTHNVKILGELVTRIRSANLLTLADVNGDGVVNIVDVVAVALRFEWYEYS